MGRNAPLAPAPRAPERANGPGSNGYFRRDIIRRPGTYTWKAEKAGKIKIQGLGAGSGADGDYPGASAAFGEKTLTVAIGDTLTIVIGDGGAGKSPDNSGVRASAGGSTSISGTPVGGSPLVLVGAQGPAWSTVSSVLTSNPVAGTATGPWDKSFPGAVPAGRGRGSPSSGSPFGPGYNSGGAGGAGWGGGSDSIAGASSHHPLPSSSQNVPPGLTAISIGNVLSSTSFNLTSPRSVKLWDLADADSAGGEYLSAGSNAAALPAGPGAGGAGGSNSPASISVLGGGTGYTNMTARPHDSGYGAGGGASGGQGGKGGEAIVFIFWDEAA
ncbi:hypothetical protein [Antarcticirhabdus aurantiaca]|uniref:Uncharacterized protein n=1 Tax=Antarcticirhabdus aurantiaca TaxID=2606717 RepID=A0ACD4NJ25_9HYPH|nr:hypothetical protein OXU80_18530 [Jeongeuplla avenae]